MGRRHAHASQEEMLADIIRQGQIPGWKQKLSVVWTLSVPAILAQLTSIMMQYIDTAMVGSLGAGASAAIGVVSTSTWLLSGLCSAVSAGFSVQAAQKVGAGQYADARRVLKHGIVTALCFSGALMLAGISVSARLPVWLGAEENIQKNASAYFFIYALSLPALQLSHLAGAMLQSSGNMRTPAVLDAAMCGLDVLFNLLFIRWFGVPGAAIGTALAVVVVCVAMLYAVCVRSPLLRLGAKEPCPCDRVLLARMVRIGLPMAFEHLAVCGAMIASTKIIAPLGTAAIAANSIAVTAESICYMPGYGIAAAASALVGQCIGAGRGRMAKSFADWSVLLGCAVMSAAGAAMYFLCPMVFALLTPDLQVQQLAARVLRIELFAEPFFAASIVASGALRGAGDTLVPCILNLVSIWGVRLTLSVLLAGRWGLPGAWFAMCMELCVRGLLLLLRLEIPKSEFRD